MAEYRSPVGPLPLIPDNLTLAQFILDFLHPSRPIRKDGTPWIIEEHTGREIGYEEIHARVYGLANGFKRRFALKEDEVVTIFSPNHIDYLVSTWATHRLGAIMSGANPHFTSDELVYQIQAAKASIIITHPEFLHVALSAARATNLPAERIVLFNVDGASYGTHTTVQSLVDEGLANEPVFQERMLRPGEGKTKVAFLTFSSGTTGRPKAVVVPHHALIASTIQIATHHKLNIPDWEDQRFKPGDIACGVLPLYHIYSLMFNTHLCFFCGMTVVLSVKFEFVNFLKSIVKYRISHLMVVPPQVVLLCKHSAVKDYDLSHVRYLTCGAAPLSRESMERLTEILPNAAIGQNYGSTEACTVVSTWSLDKKCDLSGSAGQIISGIIARVEKPDGTLADFDEPGELVIRTPSASLGYVGNPKATQETFVNGWLRMGDKVRMNRNGEIFVLDRLKEMLKVRGYQVAPAELEGCILDHPDVLDTCVVGIPDEYSGELPLAFVVLRPGLTNQVRNSPREAGRIKQSIMKHVADNKVGYKKLAGGVEFIDVIPKNPSGKLLRRVLRDKARTLIRPDPVAKL